MSIKVLLIFAKLGNNLQYHFHFRHQLQIRSQDHHFFHKMQLWISKTTLNFDILLKSLAELTESFYTHSYSLLQ